MSSKVTLIDYGVGNILSVTRAFEYGGAKVHLSSDVKKIANADILILPGVGAFGVAMQELQSRGIEDGIKEFFLKDRPFLGICLGMQMMLEWSEEFGMHKGLGVIPGGVVEIPTVGTNGFQHKIPHIGWAPIYQHDQEWDNTILAEVSEGSSFYFVHSFTARPQSSSNLLAETVYNGLNLSSVISKGNIYGCQFHPEKSGPVGLKVISNLLSL